MIDPGAFGQTTDKARGLVSSFAERYALRPENLLALRPDGRPHHAVRLFAHHAVFTELSESWDTDGFMSRQAAKQTPLFFEITFAKVGAGTSQNVGFASWCYGVRPSRSGPDALSGLERGVFASAVDEESLRYGEQQAKINAHYLRIRLFYHELAHVLFHRGNLFASGGGVDQYERAIKATPEMEQQAWVFSMTVIGLAMADHAYRLRQRPDTMDDAWLCPGHVGHD